MKEFKDTWEDIEELSDQLEGHGDMEDLEQYEDLLEDLQVEDDKQ